MRRDVFGLGTSQFVITSAVGTLISLICGLPGPAAVTVGGSLALSSSAFVLELLKDKKAMGTRHGEWVDCALILVLVLVLLFS